MKKNIWFIGIGLFVIILGLVVLTFISGKKEKLDVTTDMQLEELENITEKDETDEKDSEKLEVDENEAVDEVAVNGMEDVYKGQPYLGVADAPLSMVIFGDYKCVHCNNYEQNVFPQIYEEYIKTGIIKYHFVNMQVQRTDSVIGGIVGEAIFKQDLSDFWSYHNAAYDAYNKEFDNETILKIVKENTKNTDIKKIEDVLNGNYEEELKEVLRDKKIAQELGVQGTPTIMINGVPTGADINIIASVVDAFYDEKTKQSRTEEEAKEKLSKIGIQ